MPRVTVTIPDDVLAAVDRLAAADERSRNSMIVRLLRAGVGEYGASTHTWHVGESPPENDPGYGDAPRLELHGTGRAGYVDPTLDEAPRGGPVPRSGWPDPEIPREIENVESEVVNGESSDVERLRAELAAVRQESPSVGRAQRIGQLRQRIAEMEGGE